MAYTVEVKESDGLRTLHFGSTWMQGAMRIDLAFVRDMVSEVGDVMIANTIIGMAQNLGLEVVAEGVETQDSSTCWYPSVAARSRAICFPDL